MPFAPAKFSSRNLLPFFALISLFCCTLASCKKKEKWLEADPAYAKYIEAYTSGTISKTSSVMIQLTADAPTTHTDNEVVKEELFEFSPAVKGTAKWIDARTIEFKPAKPLTPGKLYEINFKLGKVTRVDAGHENFRFTIQTTTPAFTVQHSGLRSAGTKNGMLLNGELLTADTEDPSAVEKLLSVSAGANIQWQHGGNNVSHQFTVKNIARGDKEYELLLKWDGQPLSIEKKGSYKIPVPAVGDFKVLDIMPVNDAQQYASVQFSDPIAIDQDLTGLLSVSNQPDVSYTINGSEVKVFLEGPLSGNYTLNVSPGIRNSWGQSLNSAFTSNVVFENRLPSVKIYGRGNILPTSGKLVLPFDAVNLSAVDVSIIKIFEDNVPQFLQENSFDGYSDLRRVGKPIVQKTIRLDNDKTLDLHQRQRFTLDINKYLQTEPGAIYRVTLGFRPEYSLYSKTAIDTTSSTDDSDEEGDDEMREDYEGYARYARDSDEDFWSRYDNYYPYGYNWRRRNDPTSKSYYSKEKWATRNIIASNIGITAKRGAGNDITVALTNILTTEPLSGIDLVALNFQQQVIGKAASGSDGFATLELKEKPFLLIAKKGTERGYLKLDDGSSLSMSRFDVAGEEIRNGIKGFVFGERGVWRPGDSMYINCIIEDKTGKLPKDHPVDFSLFTPNGQLYRHAIQSGAPGGFYVFKTATATEAPTGNWLARIKVGGAAFEKRLKVETVMPNRLKINLDFGQDAVLGKNSNNTGNLKATWLFGSPGKNLKAKIDASLVSRKTVFSKLPGFEFDNPTIDYSTQTKTIFDGTLDESGNGTVKPDFSIQENAPGMLSANLLVKVFEPGGSFSIDNMNILYSPFQSYAGIKMPAGEKPFNYLLAGKSHTIQLADVNSKGELLAGARDVEVQFYKIQWRWWWDEGSDNLSNFTQDRYNKLIKKETVTLSNGKGQWSFNTSSTEWGRYLVLVKDLASGHVAGSVFYIDEPGWQTRSGDEDQSAASMLSFTSNKEKYNVDEEIVLTIPSSKGGRMLLSLENGSRVIKSSWHETVQGHTVIKFKAEAGMAPNIYATVSMLQPHAQTLNDLPIRMYGSVPLFIEDKNTVLKPVLSMPAAVRPEQQVSLTVSEQQGREMSYCVAVVDEGLLDLTRFKTPDPHAAFYAREALGVKSFDLFDNVIGAWGGDLARILSIGGDADAGPSKQKTANRFKPVVKYLGPFQLKKGQKQTHSFLMPSYIGSVKTMVVAAYEGSYGFTDKTVAVKKPLMLLTTLPRVLSPGESIRLPVTVFAMEKNISNVNVSLQSNSFFEVTGASTQALSFSDPGEKLVYFDLKIKNAIGIGKLVANATSAGEKATEEVEIDVRNPNEKISIVQQVTLSPGQEWKAAVAPIGIPALSTAVIELSSIPSLDLQKRLSYLIEYPYGCVEQTTSSVFPQLFLAQLSNLTDFQKASVDKNIKSGISKLQQFQRPGGGFSYWPGEVNADDWGSTYVGHFLLEATKKGYSVSDQIIQEWKGYQKGKANGWVPSSNNFYGGDLAQAYRLYSLALAKAPELGAMNRLKEFRYLSPEAKWRLAAAYKLAGQDNIALDLISGLPLVFAERQNPGFTYGSELRDLAMALETLTLMGKRDKATQLVNMIAGRLSAEQWYSTQTTAFSLLAVAKFCGQNPNGQKLIVTANVGGKNNTINSSAYLVQEPVSFTSGSTPVSIVNNGNNTIYLKLITQGQPLTGDSAKPVNNPALLQMNVEYITQDGKTINSSALPQGTDFIAKVTVRNTGRRGTYTQMALAQIFPAGWEIINTRMIDGEAAIKSSPMTYQDTRDDRVYTYFNLNENETRTYYVQLNATYPGHYYMPAVRAHAMYENSISASTSGRWVDVVNNR